MSKHGAHWPLSEIRSVVQRADVALVNLECVLSTCGARIDKGARRPFYYRAHPQLLDVLSRAGINVVTTSNDHAMDYGPEALLEQNRLLGKCGFAVCGAGTTLLEAARPTYVKAGDLTMAVIGIKTEEPFGAATGATPGVNHAKGKDAILRRLVTSIGEAREHADLIVASPHWGANWVERPTPERRELARQIIELGADAILGHSAHILQGVEVYKGYPIVYDMGSLLFDRVQEDRMHQSALFELEFCETGFSRLTIHPLRLRSGRATLPNRQEADDILALIRTLSMELGPLPWNAASGTISISLEPEFERKQRSRIDASEIMIGSRWPQALPSQYAQSPTAALLEDLPRYADFLVNDDIVLVGAQIPEAVRPGRGFLVDILLRVAGPLVGRWEGRITAHDEQGQAAFTWTHPISDGDVSPTQWRTGQLILNKTLVRPPRDYPVGRYSLYFDLVDRDSDRHICPLSKREVLADQVSLGTITATPRARGGIAGL